MSAASEGGLVSEARLRYTRPMSATPPSPFSPGRLGPLELRNRVIKTATFEGMTPDGLPADALIEHHRAVAAGGVGMTTVAYCSVARDGLTFAHQMHMCPEVVPGLRRLTEAVHTEGAAACLQLGHAGYFANPEAAGCRPLGASVKTCLFTLARCRAATDDDLVRLRDDFATAAARAVDEAGFDAVELHLGHGYLLSQFLSPFTNRRRDGYGGELAGRLRFPLEVVAAVRERLAPRAALIAKTNLSDGFAAGLGLDEAIEVARALQAAGVDGLVLSGGFVSKTPFYMLRGELPVREMVRNESKMLRRTGLRLFGRLCVPEHAYSDLFFLEPARRVRRAVSLPLSLLGGIRTRAHLDTAMAEGFEFASLGRPLILEPDLVQRLADGTSTASRCQPCNRCVAEMEAGGIRCSHPELGPGEPRA